MANVNENFYYITIATKPHPVLDVLIKTVENKGENIEVLGLARNMEIGHDMSNLPIGIGRSLGVKLIEVHNFINRNCLEPNDIVLFSDAYDVYYCGNKSTIIDRFKKMNKPIIFGAEQCCYPDGSKHILYPHSDNRFRFLNSGLFIGRVYALRECMKDYIVSDEIINDQLWWTNKFLERQDIIGLDYTHELFLNCLWVNEKELSIKNDQVIFNNNIDPQLIHGNGPSKLSIIPLLNFATNKFKLPNITF